MYVPQRCPRPGAGAGANALPTALAAGVARVDFSADAVAASAVGGGGAQRRYLDTPMEHLQLSRHQLIANLVDALNTCGRSDEADNVSDCCRSGWVYDWPCGDHVVIPIHCDHPLCPNCSAHRSKPLQRKILALTRSNKRHYRFLTLTVVNVEEIDRAYVDRLIGYFRALRATELWKARVLGGVYAFDTTYNYGACTWHVHLHAIIEMEPPPQNGRERWWGSLKAWTARLKVEWKRITGDSWVVHMRAVNKRAVKELVKYQAKAATFVFRPELVHEYLSAFRNVRRIQCFGSFLGVKVAPEAEEKAVFRCRCGLCAPGSWVRRRVVSMEQTEVGPDGRRQLRLDLMCSGPPPDLGPPVKLAEWPEPVFPLSQVPPRAYDAPRSGFQGEFGLGLRAG